MWNSKVLTKYFVNTLKDYVFLRDLVDYLHYLSGIFRNPFLEDSPVQWIILKNEVFG